MDMFGLMDTIVGTDEPIPMFGLRGTIRNRSVAKSGFPANGYVFAMVGSISLGVGASLPDFRHSICFKDYT